MIGRICNGGNTGSILTAPPLLVVICLGLPNLLMAVCAGDITEDGKVDGKDFAVFLKESGRTDCFTAPCRSDLDGDGLVNDRDKKILQSDLGRMDCAEALMNVQALGGRDRHDGATEASAQKESQADKQNARVGAKEETTASEEGAKKTREETAERTPAPAIADWMPVQAIATDKKSMQTRFKDNRDGTVTDVETGLMWTKEANLTSVPVLYHDARSYVAEMNRGKQPNFGYSDWRLPTLAELRSLKDFTNYTGDRKYFPPEGHPFEHVQAMNLEDYYAWPTYFWDTKLSWIGSAYCRLVGRNAGTCIGFVWAVRDGRKN